ncbi:MAG TPA: helix-turn-helix domain-containing protein [Candidatus Barnesiella excrementigallinarum]|nr:helix-turn-helix domain-containing protein [Candidatus Barnesiella excrementigallinarum]
MKEGKKLVYSGEKLRRFLHREGLTYKDAAQELGLDKNTIGKAVRGGNMNINVLLSIANNWNIPITDFFTFVNQEECEGNYFISPDKYRANENRDVSTVEEDSKIYKNIKNLSTKEAALRESKQKEIYLLQHLIHNYQERIVLLQKELEENKTE